MESMVGEPLSISTNYHNKYGTRNSPIGETAFAEHVQEYNYNSKVVCKKYIHKYTILYWIGSLDYVHRVMITS